MSNFVRFRGYTERTKEQLADEKYLPSATLATAVNTALAAEQPLLITGEPGTGKTTLALSIAKQLEIALYFDHHTRSDHQARDLLYRFDGLRRLYDAQRGGRGIGVSSFDKYIRYVALGAAIVANERAVVLIDEIDKAPRDLPNDLLNIIEKLEFVVEETNEKKGTKHPPIVVITSNNERLLPEPFLRRCVFHRLKFPEPALLAQILGTHFPKGLSKGLVETAIERFEQIRKLPLEKRPATSELIAWVRVLQRAEITLDERAKLAELPHLGVLLKTQADLEQVTG